MAATTNSHTSSNAASVPFSYAQAAKGQSAAPGSTASKASSSGAATPAKDSQSVSSSAAAVMSWAEDAEANDPRSEKSSSTREPRIPNVKPSEPSSELTAAALSSPEMGASTASTVTKDDDVSSVPNTSSDSTWENKSQASTSVEKSTEASEKTSQKGKGKKREQPPAKPLQEAPLPTVNIWQQRAELRQKPGKPAATGSAPNGSAVKQAQETDNADVKGGVAPTETKPIGAEEKNDAARQESRTETDAKRSTRGRPQEKETKEHATVFSLPLDRDQESWPTMGAAIDEDRKKAQEKTEKSDKERKESVGAKTGGKGQWVKVPFVPSVNFNTPLPSTGARRGGRSTARGGAQSGARFNANGPEKDASSPAALSHSEQSRNGRSDAPIRETSPKAKRTASAGSLAPKDKSVQSNGDKLAKPSHADVDQKGTGPSTETQNGASGSGQHNAFPRQYPSNRPNKGRRTDWNAPKKDGDSSSPAKENGVSNDRTSASTQTDAPEDSERRANYPDGQPPHQSKRGSNYGGYNSRERRGGGRGTRGGNFSNGHQFSNGHMSSMKQSSAFAGPMSPTAFNPEQTPYFPQPRFNRNNQRSQSVTGENIYRMPGQYNGPQQMSPINTYVGGNGYEYGMMQHPLSAVPYNQFGMDHFALFSMVTTQLEYYFSLENLCKDMFLRKHMDSKGFVFLNVISEFNRIKQLTTDVELIKLVCYQSRLIEFRVGHDGKDRLRARENWQQWVLPTEERDSSAQNEGPEELYNPPVPHPHGFDPNGNPRYPDASGVSPSAPGAYGNEGLNPAMNGFQPGASQHASVVPSENAPNGVASEHVNGDALPNGNPIDDSSKAVSDEPDSFSDEQVKSLTVIVREQNDSQMPVWSPSLSSSFSNASYSRSDTSDESEETTDSCATLKPNGAGLLSRVDSEAQDQVRRTPSAFAPTSPMTCSQYWVKDQNTPVNVAPPGCFHESYAFLRSKALNQRRLSVSGGCSHDMSVLYQFWSHFLVRNFNTRMYAEFCLFAVEDSRDKLSDVGISNLIKFYGESVLSNQDVVRENVVRDFIDLIRSEEEPCRPAFDQLRSALHDDNMNARNRTRINELLDEGLKASLD